MSPTRVTLLAAALLALPALAADPKAKGPKPPLTFGLAQPYGEEQAQKAATLIAPYLSKALGGPVTAKAFATADELRDALADGKVDIAWIPPLAFVQAQAKNHDIAPLNKAMRQGGGSLFYRAVFVVGQGSAAKSLADLKGKKVAWVSKSSTSGYLFPRELLRQGGFNPDAFFSAESFAGDHLAACKALAAGQADVAATFASEPTAALDGGATPELVADGCADAGPAGSFRVVASSARIPNEVIAVRADFPPTRTNDVIAAFGRLTLSAEGKALLKDAFRADGFGVAVEGDFDPIVELLKPKAGKPAPGKK